MRYLAIAVALMLAVTTAGTAVAGDIFKWTDEEGNVHFGDRPDGGEGTEKVAINQARVQAAVQSRAEAAAKAAEEEAAATPPGPTPEELQAQADERAEKCSKYREQLQRFVRSRRLYREDENGERVYLDEDEMQAAREKAENQVQDYCT
jgi:DNA helicase IV